MAPADDEASWPRQLLIGLGALTAISLLVGAIVGAVALGAAKLTGIDSAAGGPRQEPSLFIPSGTPSTSPEASPTRPSRTPRPRPITLQAFPATVSPGERINLTGVYPRGEGATMQVQRFEGGWTDFPVTARVSGGTFSTYILTSRTGATRLRVTDIASGRSSNPVRVMIR